MRINVVGRNIEVTQAIREHAEAKAAKLTKFLDMVQQVTLTLSKADHHKHGQFETEVVVDVEHHPDFVVHVRGEDLYATIDEAVHKSARQLTDFKEQLKSDKR